MSTSSTWASLIATPTQSENSRSIDFSLLKEIIEEGHIQMEDLFTLTHPVRLRSIVRGVNADVKASATLWATWLINQKNWEQAATNLLDLMDSKMYQPNWLDVVVQDPKLNIQLNGLDLAALCFSNKDFRKVLSSLSDEEIQTVQSLTPQALAPCVSAHLCSDDKLDAILELGWDIDQVNSDGNSAVFTSTHWSQVKELLDKGANVLQTTAEGKTLWDVFPMWTKTSDQMKEIGSYLDHKLSLAKPAVATEQDLRVSKIFTNINSSLVSGLATSLKSLSKVPNPSGVPATNPMGLTFIQSLIKVMNSKYQKNRNAETKRSYFRFANHFLAASPHPWIDLNYVPDAKFPQMTELDHLMTGTLLFSFRRSYHERVDIGEDLGRAITLWPQDKLRQSLDNSLAWIGEYTTEKKPVEMMFRFFNAYLGDYGQTMFGSFDKPVSSYWSSQTPSSPLVYPICRHIYNKTPWSSDFETDNLREFIYLSGSYDPQWVFDCIVDLQQRTNAESPEHQEQWDRLLVDAWAINSLMVVMGEELSDDHFKRVHDGYDIVNDPQFIQRNQQYLTQVMSWWFHAQHQGSDLSYSMDSNFVGSIQQHSRNTHSKSDGNEKIFEVLNKMEAMYFNFELKDTPAATRAAAKRKI